MSPASEGRSGSAQPAFSTADSILLKVRRDVVARRAYFLLWGWFAFAAFLLQYVLKVVFASPQHYLVWLGLLPLAVFTVLKANRQQKQIYTSVIGDCMRHLWTALGFSFFVVGLMAGLTKGANVYGYFILLYGIGTFVSGRLLKFAPLATGGAFCWPLALACSLLKPDGQLLVAAAAILVSYIIPAHLLNPDVQSWKTIFRTKKA